jgi:alpha-D-xyloside xylohydrolase
MGPAIQYAADNPDGPIDLRVYRGANGSFTLYGDDGTTYDYEKGAYATIPVTWDDARQTLTIGARSGKYAGMPSKRTFRIVLVSPSIGVGVEPSKMAAKVVMYAGKPIRVRMR